MPDDVLSKPVASSARSVQSYIDERPLWPDGTGVSSTPMTAMQWRIWSLAAFGKFFEGLVVFMTGVAMPLIAKEFGMSAVQHGMVGAASLAGILVGASALGGLSDYYGRRTMIIAESIPSSMRGRLVLGAFGFQALGALTGTLVGWLVLKNLPEVEAWRWMYATAIIPAVIVTVLRFTITESAPWQLHRGHHEKAAVSVKRLLSREPPYPREVVLSPPRGAH